MTENFEHTTGRLQNELGNAISTAIHNAVRSGLEFDEACCTAIAVVADYARGTYGNRYLKDLAKVVREQAHRPMPQIIGPN